MNEGSARRRDLYLTTHNTHTGQIFMSAAGFELSILASEGPKFLVLDWSATGIGHIKEIGAYIYELATCQV